MDLNKLFYSMTLMDHELFFLTFVDHRAMEELICLLLNRDDLIVEEIAKDVFYIDQNMHDISYFWLNCKDGNGSKYHVRVYFGAKKHVQGWSEIDRKNFYTDLANKGNINNLDEKHIYIYLTDRSFDKAKPPYFTVRDEVEELENVDSGLTQVFVNIKYSKYEAGSGIRSLADDFIQTKAIKMQNPGIKDRVIYLKHTPEGMLQVYQSIIKKCEYVIRLLNLVKKGK